MLGYMDLGCGLGVKEGLDSVPEQPEPLPGIDDEHPAQRLRIDSKSQTASFSNSFKLCCLHLDV